MNTEPLDVVPLWCFLPVATAIGMLAVEAGYRFGKWRRTHASEEKVGPVGAMVGSLLALLAIMLAFTFNLAATRFDARRQAVLEEANAIGTTYLRTRLLPEPQRADIAELLRIYTELRVRNVAEARITEVMTGSEKLHEQIWSQAVAAAEKTPGSITTGLFLQSLNQVIDLHSKRVFVGVPPENSVGVVGAGLMSTVSLS
jgi:hypothetical protein